MDWDADLLQLQSTQAEINASLGTAGWGKYKIDSTSGQLDIAGYRFSATGPDFDLVSLNFTVLKARSSKINIDLGQSNIGDWYDDNNEIIAEIDYKGYRLKKKGR